MLPVSVCARRSRSSADGVVAGSAEGAAVAGTASVAGAEVAGETSVAASAVVVEVAGAAVVTTSGRQRQWSKEKRRS